MLRDLQELGCVVEVAKEHNMLDDAFGVRSGVDQLVFSVNQGS